MRLVDLVRVAAHPLHGLDQVTGVDPGDQVVVGDGCCDLVQAPSVRARGGQHAELVGEPHGEVHAQR